MGGAVRPARARAHPWRDAAVFRGDIERALQIRTLTQERSYTLEAIARLIDETEVPLPSAVGTSAENVYLWEAANREYIEEGRRMAAVHPLLRQLVCAESGWSAAVALVKGVKALAGALTASLGLYRQNANALSFVVTVRGNSLEQLPRPPLVVSSLPRSWQEALGAREPYCDSDLLRLDLPQEITVRISEDRTRSFYAAPLTVGKDLVGVLIIGSPQPGGMSREARELCERVAVPAGPAIYYYASGL